MGYTAYNLTTDSIKSLKKIFPPKFSKFIGHHITVNFGVKKDAALPSKNATVLVTGYLYDTNGLEVLLVNINGKSKRADGSLYHITWSLENKFKPVDNNKLIKEKTDDIQKVFAVPIRVVPAYNN